MGYRSICTALAIGVFAFAALPACQSLRDRGVLVPPERNALPEYPARAVQHRVLSVLWRVPLMKPDALPVDHVHHGQVALDPSGRRAYVGSHDGSFYCVDTLSGKLLWRNLVKGPFDSQPTVSDGVVYSGSGGGSVYAWRASDGEPLWSYQAGAGVDSHPVVRDDKVCVVTDANELVCLNALTGKWLWNYRRDVPSGRFQIKGVSTPLIAEGVIYVGFSDGTLAKLSLADGSVMAVKKLSDRDDQFTDVDTEPLLVSPEVLLVGVFGRGLLALNPQDLSERWVHKADGISSMARAEQRVYFSTADSKIEALQIDKAATAWRFDARIGSLSQPVLAGNWLLVSSSEHSLLVLDRRDGRLLQIFNPGKGSGAAPTVAGDRVYWISNGQTLYCMGIVR